MLAVSRGIDSFTNVLGNIALWVVAATVMVGAWNTFGRFIGPVVGTNMTSNLFIELQWYFFSLTYFLAGGYVLKHNGHVRVDIFYDSFNDKQKALVNILGTIFLLFPFCAMMITFAYPWVMQSWKILEGSPDPSGLPRYPLKTMVVAGMGFLAMQGVSELIKNIAIYTGYEHTPSEDVVAEHHTVTNITEEIEFESPTQDTELSVVHHTSDLPHTEATKPAGVTPAPTSTKEGKE